MVDGILWWLCTDFWVATTLLGYVSGSDGTGDGGGTSGGCYHHDSRVVWFLVVIVNQQDG